MFKTNESERFCLGEWRVAPDANQILRNGESKKLDHKVMQLLLFLAENAGRDLTKEEILKAVWGEGVFTDEVLTVAVSSLRKALGDDSRAPKYVKTIPRVGYRMLVQPDEVPARRVGKRRFLEFLDERIGLRFLIVSFIVILFLVVMLTKRHAHF